jgi:MFS family permease
MIASDIVRVLIALGFLLVHRPQDLWIAYVCTALLSFFGAFFEAAKNAAVPNITGERDLLAGNALMFSSRFLLMSLGAALGGWTSAHVGYQAAFVINAAKVKLGCRRWGGLSPPSSQNVMAATGQIFEKAGPT